MNEITFQELIDYVLLESGQYMAPLEATLLTDTHVARIVTRELSLYSKYRPVSREVFVSANVSGEVNFKTLSTDEKERDIPMMITNVRVPHGEYGISPAAIANYSYSPVTRERLVEAPTSNFDYRKPILYLAGSGGYKLTAHYSRYFDYAEINGKLDGVISDISFEDDHLFVEMLIGKFLQYVGRSRRAFTIDNLPITYDSSEMVSEGQEKYNEAYRVLTEENSKWYEGVLG